MELRAYVRMLIKGWWLILSALLITVAATLVLTYTQTPTYKTTATFIVSPSASFKDLQSVLQGLDTLSRREGINETYNNVVTSRTVVEAGGAEMGLTPADLKRFRITSEVLSSANIIKITVEGNDPALVAELANHVGTEAIEYVQTLYEAYDLKTLDAAIAPKDPVKPNKRQNLILATIVGLGLGVALAFVVEYLKVPVDSVAGVNVVDNETGVYNKAYFLQRLSEELCRSRRHNYPLSMALMSIERLDTFKGLYSPQLRTEALRKVAVFLKQNLREEDLIARFEGNMFALLFPDTPGQQAKEILEKLQTRIEWTAFEVENTGFKLNLTSLSGVMPCDYGGIEREELLARAEKALRYAGANGHGQVYLWEEAHSTAVANGSSD